MQVAATIMDNWFGDGKSVNNRGLIFGVWSCHRSFGELSAALCTAWVLTYGLEYWWAIFIPAVMNVVWSFFAMTLTADPADAGIVTAEVKIRMEELQTKRAEMAGYGLVVEDGPVAEDGLVEAGPEDGPQPISFVAALAIPMVVQYVIACGFFKFINYVFYFWLPYFLGRIFDPVTANYFASAYTIGQMPGGFIVGRVSDLFGGRQATVICTFMSALLALLGIFTAKSEELSPIPLLAMLFCIGLLVGGANHVMPSAVVADLRATQSQLVCDGKSLGTVTGRIHGTGSIMAAIGLLTVGPIQESYGWEAVWLCLIGCTTAGVLLLSPKMKKELTGSN